MTMPQGIPVSPTIEALRRELAAVDGMTLQMGVMPLIDAARAVLTEYDSQVAAMNAAMSHAAERAFIEQASGIARGTLDP